MTKRIFSRLLPLSLCLGIALLLLLPTSILFASSNINITDDNFEHKVIQSNKPVLVFFWAQWCGPSKTIAPIVKQLANQYHGRIKVMKMNVDDYPKTPNLFSVSGTPTWILFKDGRVVSTQVGLFTKSQLNFWIDKNT